MKPRIIFILLLVALLCFSFWRYYQSSVLIKAGDIDIKNGNPEEAIIHYDQAYRTFPFRQDVVNDLNGARLILQSDLDYGKIYEIGTELQIEPPLSQKQAVFLKQGEVYVPILMYHHIRDNPKPEDPVWQALNVSVPQLDAQLSYFASHNYHSITLSELYDSLQNNKPLPENPIVLTFDDGYRSFYDNAFPLLKKYNIKSVEFMITDVEGASAYLTWKQILEMDKTGLVEWGAHTRHHPNLPDLSQSALVNEIVGSKQDLETHLKRPVNWFAYPYGSYNDNIVKLVSNSGFEGAVTTNYGAVQSKDKIFLLPRIMVDGRFTLANLIARIEK